MQLSRSFVVLFAVLVLALPATAAPGDLDTTFSADGMVLVDNDVGDEAGGLALQGDGKILQAGETGLPGVDDFMVVRYTRDGVPDSTFGGDGIVTTDFFGADDYATGVISLPGNKTLAVGYGRPSGGVYEFALAQYNANGTPDGSFGGDGKVTTPFPGHGYAYAALRLTDGSIVVVGERYEGHGDFALAKYRPNGALDTSFSGDGKRTLDFAGGSDGAVDIVAAGDRLLLSGWGMDGPSPNDYDIALARFKRGGALDRQFSGDGKRLLSLGAGSQDYADGLVRLGDGRFVVAAGLGGGDVALAKFKPGGGLDGTFGGGDGKALVDFGANETVSGLARVARGYAVGVRQSNQMGGARFGPRGSPIGSFGTGGLALAAFANQSFVTGVANQDGKMVTGGFAFTGTSNDFAVARFLT
ncbi:MAG TPA: delta-60 repeat domain-containing protein [Actinomycetota bacterium]|nr:delta-60 repeat domain-containing protein [Actinomycetota bacterium]